MGGKEKGGKEKRGNEKGEMRNEKVPCGVKSRPDGALPLFIGGGDHVVVRGCK